MQDKREPGGGSLRGGGEGCVCVQEVLSTVLSKCVLSAECIVAVANGSAGLVAERGDSTTQRESSSGESVQG